MTKENHGPDCETDPDSDPDPDSDLLLRRYNYSLFLALLLAALFIPAFFSHGPWNPDEPRYLEVVREMRLTGDPILLRLNGRPYGEKPPLFFWLAAAMSMLTGEYVIAARFISAISAVSTVALTIFFARRAFPGEEHIGCFAGIILATTVLFFYLGQHGVIDPLLTAATTGAIIVLLSARLGRTLEAPVSIMLAASAMIFGMLAKGPVGMIVPVAVAVFACAICGGRRAVPARAILVGGVISTVAALGWLYAASLRAGAEGGWYWNRLLLTQTLGRLLSSWSHRQPPYYYSVQLVWGTLPWILFLPSALLAALQKDDPGSRADGDDRKQDRNGRCLAICWLAVVFILFSAISSKRPGYILPLYPAVALVLAARFGKLSRRKCRPNLLDILPAYVLAGALILIAPVIALAPLMFPSVVAGVADIPEDARLLIYESIPRSSVFLAPVFGAVLLVLGMWLAYATHARAWPCVVTLLGSSVAITSVFVHLLIFPALDPIKSFNRFGQALRQAVPAGERIVLFGHDYDGLVGFATGAFGYEVFEQSTVNLFTSVVNQAGRLWVVADDNHPLPQSLVPRFKLHLGERVGHRKMLLYREIG
jgi:4-amino-4-deoxy-L-arabinose transferase-like glycosyltransferase